MENKRGPRGFMSWQTTRQPSWRILPRSRSESAAICPPLKFGTGQGNALMGEKLHSDPQAINDRQGKKSIISKRLKAARLVMQSGDHLPDTSKMVFWALCESCSRSGHTTRIKQSTIARQLGKSERTVRRAVGVLRGTGLITTDMSLYINDGRPVKHNKTTICVDQILQHAEAKKQQVRAESDGIGQDRNGQRTGRQGPIISLSHFPPV